MILELLFIFCGSFHKILVCNLCQRENTWGYQELTILQLFFTIAQQNVNALPQSNILHIDVKKNLKIMNNICNPAEVYI